METFIFGWISRRPGRCADEISAQGNQGPPRISFGSKPKMFTKPSLCIDFLLSPKVLNSNFFIIFCYSRPFLWPPKCASTQYRFSTLYSPLSKGYTTKDDSHQRLHNPRWYPSKCCITQDATHQRLHNQRWHPSKGYTTNDDTTRYPLLFSFTTSVNKYFFMSKGRKETIKHWNN